MAYTLSFPLLESKELSLQPSLSCMLVCGGVVDGERKRGVSGALLVSVAVYLTSLVTVIFLTSFHEPLSLPYMSHRFETSLAQSLS